MAPVPARTVATVFCWVVELTQLTGVPVELSARSLAARLALGLQFDPVDLAWYPAGVAFLVALHPGTRPPRYSQVQGLISRQRRPRHRARRECMKVSMSSRASPAVPLT
ncbi:DUF2809 domain-containing protein [Micromonospora sp. CPCC 205539]|uniref:DUF2809 domain-containing protein n=1 Tax=Micromonospora sp. CPCC 205539 TaxID=3122408 RepID=UPI003FA5D533